MIKLTEKDGYIELSYKRLPTQGDVEHWLNELWWQIKHNNYNYAQAEVEVLSRMLEETGWSCSLDYGYSDSLDAQYTVIKLAREEEEYTTIFFGESLVRQLTEEEPVEFYKA